MDKIKINLTLEFNIPEKGLTINGLLITVKKTMRDIFLHG